MSYTLNEKHMSNVLALPAQEKLEYFIGRVVDWEEVWGLKDDSGWASSTDNAGVMSIPFWPHLKFAKLCNSDLWKGNIPTPISLIDFMSKWLPGLNNDGLKVAVFPTPSGKSIQLEPSVLLEQLELECEKYE